MLDQEWLGAVGGGEFGSAMGILGGVFDWPELLVDQDELQGDQGEGGEEDWSAGASDFGFRLE